MKFRNLTLLFIVLMGSQGMQAALGSTNDIVNEQVLFSIGDDSVKLSEFEYVYNKNNVNDENSYSKESLEEYLELYINFRLKVKEAEELGLDTVKSINDELATYRTQLAKSYLYDREVSEHLLREAHERLQTEVRASHILFPIHEAGLPADTLEAYNDAIKVRNRLLKGEDFTKLAEEFSADPSVKTNGGDIGYFTAFQTVYPFESAAFNTEVGGVSMPVRTRFGYHLVKVTDKRPAQGKIQAAHILIKIPPNATPEQISASKEKADQIVERLKNGESFDEVAKQASEDKLSASKGGVLPEFGTGKMVQEFENAAFALQKDGNFSEPVKTEYGWHIIKRISKTELPPFEEMKTDLKKRVEKDSRSDMARTVLVKQIKKDYNFKEYSKAREALYKKIGDAIIQSRFVMNDKSSLDKTLFKLADQTFTQLDFVEYLEKNQKKKRNSPAYTVFSDYYDKFVELSCLDYEESQLENKYPEFKALMKEYHDGILLFELTDKKVWSKAIKDTVGLKEFHANHRNDYMWGERADAVIYTAKNEQIAKTAKKLVKKGKLSLEEIMDKINTDEEPDNLKSVEGKYEEGQNELIDQVGWEARVSEDIQNQNGSITFVQVNKTVEPTPKSLNQAKGFIVSDYQEYLEKEWIKELRAKYPVEVNKEVFYSLIK